MSGLRWAAERLVDVVDSSPETAAFIAERYPGLDHSIDLIRRNIVSGPIDEEDPITTDTALGLAAVYDEQPFPSALSEYERGRHPCPPKGGCRVCGCAPDKMPMVFRGTGWCSENHRKEYQGK